MDKGCRDKLFEMLAVFDDLLDMDELSDDEFDELNDLKHKLDDIYEEG